MLSRNHPMRAGCAALIAALIGSLSGLSVLSVLSVLSACTVTQPPPPQPKPVPPATTAPPSAPVPAPPSSSAPQRPLPNINFAGYSAAFKEGFRDGCDSFRGSYRRDNSRFSKDGDYSMGWQDGFSICRRQGK
jgi:hypothetical protein